jgi:hypothetical protein
MESPVIEPSAHPTMPLLATLHAHLHAWNPHSDPAAVATCVDGAGE